MKKLLVILMVMLSITMVGCGTQETKTSNRNQNEAVERKECVDSQGNEIYTIDDEYAKTLEYNSKTNQY